MYPEEEIVEGLAEIARDLDRLNLRRRYMDGDHRHDLTDRKLLNRFGDALKRYNLNLCAAAVRARTDRLKWDGFGVEDSEATGEDKVDALLDLVQKSSRFPTVLRKLKREAVAVGRAGLIVWPDANGTPIITFQRGDQIFVKHDEENPSVRLWGIKAWPYKEHVRVNFYGSDGIYKYITTNISDVVPTRMNQLSPWNEDGEPWPVPNPFDVPVLFMYDGESLIDNGINPQDGLNKILMEIIATADFYGAPQRSASGVAEIPGAPRDRALPDLSANRPGQVIGNTNPNFSMNQFEPGDLEKLIATANLMVKLFGSATSTPIHNFGVAESSQALTGEAARRLNQPLLASLDPIQEELGYVLSEAAELALRQAGAAAQVSAKWQDPEPLSESEELDIAAKKRDLKLHPDRVILEELGYADTEALEMLDEVRGDTANVGEQAILNFNRGADA